MSFPKHYDVRIVKTGHNEYHLGIISWEDMDCLFENDKMSSDEVFAVLEEYGVINNYIKSFSNEKAD